MTVFNEVPTSGVGLSTVTAPKMVVLVTDQLGLTAAFSESALFLVTPTDTVGIAAADSLLAIFTNQVGDELGLNDTEVESVALQVTLSDSLTLRLQTFDEGADHVVWVMETQTKSFTEYSGVQFNSYMEVDNKNFGALSDGIYELTGDDDAGTQIDAEFSTGVLDFANGLMTRLKRAYVGYRSNGDIILQTVTNEEVERWYKLSRTTNGLKNERIKTGNVKSKYWQITILNSAGSDFDIDTLQLYPLKLKRRVR